MCGIAGVFHRDGRPAERSMVARMTAALAHRGPDGDGLYLEGPVGLGHRRLAVRDISAAGRQPMSDPDGRVVVSYNGEIYNYPALRRTLERDHGCVFRTDCDTEILPLGYRVWGPDLFARLEGMFALALWDAAAERLILARDGVGIKPLVLARRGPAVYFASEPKAIFATDAVPPTVAPAALHAFLAQGYVGPEATLFADIEQVPPGTVMTLDRTGLASHRFWSPTRRPEVRSLDQAVEAFAPLWTRVVEDHLASDVPVGVLQSGGVDSSLVSLGVAARAGAPPPLFTAAFEEASHDESDLAGAVARSAGLALKTITVDAEAGAIETLRAIAHHVDGQLADTSAYPHYLLSRAVRSRVTVALAGDGADDFFGGYPTYAATRIAGRGEAG